MTRNRTPTRKWIAPTTLRDRQVTSAPRRTGRGVGSALLITAVSGLLAGCGSSGLITIACNATAASRGSTSPAALSVDFHASRSTGMGGNIVTTTPAGMTSIMTFGARCDGTTDDTTALQRAFDTIVTGTILQIPAGRACAHSGQLLARNAGLHVAGPGTLLATDPANSAIQVTGADVTIENMLIRETGATTRLTSSKNAGVAIDNAIGTTIRQVTLDDFAQNGIFNYGGSNFLFDSVTVNNSLADCIHNTHGAHNGVIVNTTSRNCGDDGVAVVSYVKDGVMSHDILIDSAKVLGQTHGRGMAVVGGENITFKNAYIERSSSASFFINAEGGPARFTYGAANIRLLGATVVDANQAASKPDSGGLVGEAPKIVKQGAILIESANPGYAIRDVEIADITIRNTDPQAGRQVVIATLNGSDTRRVVLRNVVITGGPPLALATTCTAPDRYSTTDWTFNGVRLPDHVGF